MGSKKEKLDAELAEKGISDGFDGLVQFNIEMDATKDFVSNLVLGREGYEIPHLGEKNKKDLRLAVAFCGSEIRHYGKQRPVTVYRFVLLDGDMAMVNAVVNSGFCKEIHGRKPPPGSMLIVSDWVAIWEKRNSENQRRVTILLNSFTWIKPPAGTKGDYDYMMAIEECGPFVHTWDEVVCSGMALRHCYDTRLICFIEPVDISGGRIVWRLADTDSMMDKGEFIVDKNIRDKYVSAKKKRSRVASAVDTEERADPVCECVSRFNLLDCSFRVKPIQSIDKDALFQEIYDRLSGNVVASDFDELRSNHKRWALYYFYYVNVLHGTASCRKKQVDGKGNKREKLPTCLMDRIRLAFPEASGEYVGFKEH